MARHKDTVWNLPEGEPNGSGGPTHQYQSVQSALLMDLRDELKESNRIQRETLDTIRHFFNALGTERVRLIVREKHRELDLRAKRRRRRLAAQKRRQRA